MVEARGFIPKPKPQAKSKAMAKSRAKPKAKAKAKAKAEVQAEFASTVGYPEDLVDPAPKEDPGTPEVEPEVPRDEVEFEKPLL